MESSTDIWIIQLGACSHCIVGKGSQETPGISASIAFKGGRLLESGRSYFGACELLHLDGELGQAIGHVTHAVLEIILVTGQSAENGVPVRYWKNFWLSLSFRRGWIKIRHDTG